MSVMRSIRNAVQAYRRDRRGAVVVLAAILMPVVIGGLGLWVETGFWYGKQRQVQHIADVAAHTAGVRIRAGDSKAQATEAARHIATQSGFPAGASLVVNIPPTTGARRGMPDAIEVVLTETRSRWFTALFAGGEVALAGRAVTVIEGDATACMLALSGTANGAVTVTGSTSVALTGCDIASNSVSPSSFAMGGLGASLTTGCVHAVGGSTANSALTLTDCPAVVTNAGRARDPYADLQPPAIIGLCQSKNVGNNKSVTALTPTDSQPGSSVKSMYFCNGFDLRGEVTLDPGIYIIGGSGLSVNGGSITSATAAKLSGRGVTFYLATDTAEIRLNGNVTLDLAAPTGGPYSGVLFFGSRTATAASHIINGSAGSVMQGAIYTPASALQFSGNSSSGSGGCTQVIASTITLTGNSALSATCAAAGTRSLWASETVRLFE